MVDDLDDFDRNRNERPQVLLEFLWKYPLLGQNYPLLHPTSILTILIPKQEPEPFKNERKNCFPNLRKIIERKKPFSVNGPSVRISKKRKRKMGFQTSGF